ncbi:MAG: response regulator [Helicobacteraceae bacterium]
MKILIVDDSKTARGYYKIILKALNANFIEAENGMEALEKIADHTDIDLFLVDINMPIMDGYTFVKKARDDFNYTKVPIIVISTEADQGDKDKAFLAGANEYFIKPIDPDMILNRIKELVKQ